MTEMLRYRWTSFGPMLDEDGPFVLLVDAEAAIDEARSQEAKVHAATERWSPLSHLQGQRDAIAAAVQRVEAMTPAIYTPIGHPHEGCPDPSRHMTWEPAFTIPDILAAIKGDQP